MQGKIVLGVTIEPILDLDPVVMVGWLKTIEPDFVNIGADSKGSKLQEPTPEKIRELIALIGKAGIEIRKKLNLERLIGKL